GQDVAFEISIWQVYAFALYQDTVIFSSGMDDAIPDTRDSRAHLAIVQIQPFASLDLLAEVILRRQHSGPLIVGFVFKDQALAGLDVQDAFKIAKPYLRTL